MKKTHAALFVMVLLLVIIFYKSFNNETTDSGRVLLSEDITKLKSIENNYTNSLSENTDSKSIYYSNLNNLNDMLIVGSTIYSMVDAGESPSLVMLKVLNDSFLLSNNREVKKFAEEKLKDLIIQISYSSNYSNSDFTQYVSLISKIGNANNSYLINEILKNNQESIVKKLLIQEKLK